MNAALMLKAVIGKEMSSITQHLSLNEDQKETGFSKAGSCARELIAIKLSAKRRERTESHSSVWQAASHILWQLAYPEVSCRRCRRKNGYEAKSIEQKKVLNA